MKCSQDWPDDVQYRGRRSTFVVLYYRHVESWLSDVRGEPGYDTVSSVPVTVHLAQVD